MADSTAPRVLIEQTDLATATQIVEARFADPELEARRVQIVRDLLSCGLVLEQALRVYVRCALVNHCGSHGSTNLADTTETFFESLSRYASAMCRVAKQFEANENHLENILQLKAV
jgi:hypothetical protein